MSSIHIRRLKTWRTPRLLAGIVCILFIFSRIFARKPGLQLHTFRNATESITISGLEKAENVPLSEVQRTPELGDSRLSQTKTETTQYFQPFEATMHGDMKNSAFSRYSGAGFPSFFTCNVVRSLPECAEQREEPRRRTQAHLIFHTVREGCNTLKFISFVRRTIADHMKNFTLYTTPYLRHSIIDFMDPPIPLIGTSEEYSRRLTAGAISEFATHMAIWREVFSLPEKTNAIVLSSYLPSNSTLQRLNNGHLELVQAALNDMGDRWDVMTLRKSNLGTPNIEWLDAERLPSVANFTTSESIDTTTYFITAKGANTLLAVASAYVLPLPDFLKAVTGLKNELGLPLIRLLQYVENENLVNNTHIGSEDKLVESEDCRLPHREVGQTLWSHQLPYYPPHHALLGVPGEY